MKNKNTIGLMLIGLASMGLGVLAPKVEASAPANENTNVELTVQAAKPENADGTGKRNEAPVQIPETIAIVPKETKLPVLPVVPNTTGGMGPGPKDKLPPPKDQAPSRESRGYENGWHEQRPAIPKYTRAMACVRPPPQRKTPPRAA